MHWIRSVCEDEMKILRRLTGCLSCPADRRADFGAGRWGSRRLCPADSDHLRWFLREATDEPVSSATGQISPSDSIHRSRWTDPSYSSPLREQTPAFIKTLAKIKGFCSDALELRCSNQAQS